MSYSEEFEESVRDYWRIRAGQKSRQEQRGVVDIGSRTETTGGKHLLPLAQLIAQVFVDEGFPEESVRFEGILNLPGYYRPTKNWDLLVVHEDVLVAAIELKSIAGSYGNNLNNRIEEALGNAEDIRTAYREEILGPTRPWLGYFFLIADEEASQRPVQVQSQPVLPIDPIFGQPSDQETLLGDSAYPKNTVSYQKRAEVFCRRLVREQLYNDACFVVSSKHPETAVRQPAPDMTFSRFVASIKGHSKYVLELTDET